MKKKRPAIITILCILGFIGALFTIPIIFSDAAKSIGSWYQPYLAFGSIVGLVCMIGLWMMKKWSVIMYTVFVAINQVVLLGMSVWTPLAFIVPAIAIAIMFSQYEHMN